MSSYPATLATGGSTAAGLGGTTYDLSVSHASDYGTPSSSVLHKTNHPYYAAAAASFLPCGTNPADPLRCMSQMPDALSLTSGAGYSKLDASSQAPSAMSSTMSAGAIGALGTTNDTNELSAYTTYQQYQQYHQPSPFGAPTAWPAQAAQFPAQFGAFPYMYSGMYGAHAPWMTRPGAYGAPLGKKGRQTYHRFQTFELEAQFRQNKYVTKRQRVELSHKVALSDRQIKIWFQNRRMKEKKENKRQQEESDVVVRSQTTAPNSTQQIKSNAQEIELQPTVTNAMRPIERAKEQQQEQVKVEAPLPASLPYLNCKFGNDKPKNDNDPVKLETSFLGNGKLDNLAITQSKMWQYPFDNMAMNHH